jgi:hypothetical protein
MLEQMERKRRLIAPALALTLLVGGCSGDEDDAAPSEPPDQAGAPTLRQRPADLDVSIARLSGSLPNAATRDLTRRLGRVVGTWIGGGFLPGGYPREHFAGYAAFTPDAARLARRDAGVTSNVRLGTSWVSVVPTLQRVRLYVFAPGHRPSGATAHVELVLVGAGTAGAVSELAVTGDLYLTRAPAGWRIFGFDLNRSVGDPGSYTARSAERDENTGKPDSERSKRHSQRQERPR